MCGIVGFFKSSHPIEEYSDIIKKMLCMIQHRGPDQAGYYLDNNIAIGTARLSIIDIKNAIQPFCDPNKRYWLSYNGELYNYKELRKELEASGVSFVTNSDTEVVLQGWIQWKEQSLKKFNGAFAFAIYDAKEVSLFLARDRFGERPLFYIEQNGAFIFASEMKAFFGYKGFNFEWDEEQLSSIFAIWTPIAEQSSYKKIKQLPMGEYIKVNKEGKIIEKRSYSKISFEGNALTISEEDAIMQIQKLLTKSVELHLQSDVETGVYLSGGLDSSIITHLATTILGKPVRTFSVEFENQEFDESAYQKLLSKRFNTIHSSIVIRDNDITENFPKALYHTEIPVFRTAFVPIFLLSERVRAEGVKVVLSGEGADEVFLGYDLFKETLLRNSWQKMDVEEKRDKLKKIYPYLNHFNSTKQTHLMGLYQQFSEENMSGLFSHEMRFQNGRFSVQLLQNKEDPFSNIYALLSQDTGYKDLSLIHRAQWLEFKTLLPGYLLSTQGDRVNLAHGLENRCPFLDPDVVNFSASVNLKFNDGFNEKYILKEAFRKVLPTEILNKPKFPYRAPDAFAFINARPDYLDLLLSEDELKKTQVLDMNFTRRFIKKLFTLSADQISTKENQTFVFLISLVLLDYFFIRRNYQVSIKNSGNIESILVRELDMRNRTESYVT